MCCMLICKAIYPERVGLTFALAVTIALITALMLCKSDHLCKIDAHAKITVPFLNFLKITLNFYKNFNRL